MEAIPYQPAPAPTGDTLILNVDDSEERLRYRSTVLRDVGFDVLEARTGTEALAAAAHARPALILLDVHLPDFDGFEVCTRLKAMPSTRDIPVLHVSAALCEDEHWVRGLRAGAEAYLREPLDTEVLREVIRTLLRRAKTAAIAERARREAEHALQASEQRYRELVEHAPYGICQTTADGRWVAANQALVTLLGYRSSTDLLAMGSIDACFLHPSEQLHLTTQLEDSGVIRHFETLWKRKDHQQIRVSVSGRVIAERYELFVEDVTERQAVEAQLRQAHKLEALGLLTSGIAHDFNNALTVILGYSDMLVSQCDDDTQTGRDLREIRCAGLHAAGLTRQLLAFSREQQLQLRVLDLNTVVADLSAMLAPLVGETVRVETSLCHKRCLVNAHPGQLQQVVFNLAANARDAMPAGGTLTLKTTCTSVGRLFAVRHPPLQPGRYVRLCVRDTGCGMDDATKHRIFDPFFTTKGAGEGTGLGLSSVYGILRQLQGFIFVESGVNQGTQFDLYFPEVEGAVTVDCPDRAIEAAAEPATILIVEDDAAVRALAVAALSRHGYRVLQAGGPQEASAFSDVALRDVDLLLTDVVMPAMSGTALAKCLRRRCEHLHVLYMSGYPAVEAPDASLVQGPMLRKPFTTADLLAAVKQALIGTGLRS
jgi:PAS domain S-box-containing protein